MTTLTLTATEQGYSKLWDSMTVRPNRVETVKSIAARIKALETVFRAVQAATNVPWQWVGAVLYREADLNLKGAFCNGDPIIGTGRKTTHVPRNMGPYATWAASAIDEIKRRGLDKIARWSVERMLFEGEAFNGWGYLGKCNSPYVWCYTILYGPPEADGGKYIADHVFSRSANDVQCGLAAIWAELALIDGETAELLKDRELKPQPKVIQDATKKANAGKRKVITGAGTAATAGGASATHKATTETATPIFETPIAVILMGGGLIIAIAAVALSVRTGNLLKARW